MTTMPVPPRKSSARKNQQDKALESLRCSLSRSGVLEQGCVVAVSGGPDSVALFHALVELRRALKTTFPLVVAHVNHQLRGAESDFDQRFVSELCENLPSPDARHVRFVSTSIETLSAASERRENLEAAARRLRYEWLANQATQLGHAWILTGHTLNDQAETVLFQALRGAGLAGLRGMAERRRLAPGVYLFRPWLDLERKEVMLFLESRKLDYRSDSSNQDRRFARNRLRLDLLPLLRSQINPRLDRALGSLSKQARGASALLAVRARKLLYEAEKPRAGSLVVLDTRCLSGVAEELIRLMFVFLWRRENWPRGRMGFKEWQTIARWLQRGGTALDLPQGIRASRKRHMVQVGFRT